MLSKMWEEQCWAFRRSPNPKKLLMKGAEFFLFWLSVASLFRVPFLDPVLEHFWGSFWDPFGVQKSTLKGQLATRGLQDGTKRPDRSKRGDMPKPS